MFEVGVLEGGGHIKQWSLGWSRARFRKWQPTPVFLPGKSYGQKSLVGYSPWGHKESDTTEHALKQANRRTLAKNTEGKIEKSALQTPTW